MGRAHIEFIDALAVEKTPITEGAFAGAEERLLSRDEAGRGDFTSLVYFPDRWSGDVSSRARPTELFLLEGALEIAGSPLTPGAYAFLPPGAPEAAVETTEDAVAVIMVDPEEPAGGAIQIVDSNELPWQCPPPESDVPPGIVVRRLRRHPVSGDTTWIAAVVPGWCEQRAEVHDTIEECLMLRGDILLGRRGVMGPGAYFWRPPGVEHGPMFTINGAMFLFCSKGGRLATTHVPMSGWQEMVARYRATRPYFTGKA